IFLIVSTLFSLWMCYFTIKKALERDKTKTKVTFYIIALLFGVVFLYEAINFIKFYEMTGLLKVETFNVLSASFAVGIMITPLVASISEDALKSVPSTLREASFGLGSTKYETVIKVVIPAAISGIISSFILGISRAIGETMIVAMAAGAKPVLNFNPLGQIQTMTGYMVSKTFGEVVVGSLEYQTVFVVGLILFFITLSLNVIAKKIVDVYREEY
ncbi:MAG: ABC transporter permease subunit, partial [Leptotrichiaceae bacterium]